MNKVNIWETGVSNKITYIGDINSIIKYIKENKKISFSVIDQKGLQDGVVTTFFVDKVNKNAKEQNLEINYVDDTHPFFYDSLGDMYFSKTFFNKNKDIILNTIKDLMFENEFVHISKYAYSDELVKNLCLTATSISFDDEIEISDEVKKILKSNHINAYFYNNGEKVRISTNQILGQDYKNVVSDSDSLYIENNITDLENLKYIPKHKTIYIKQANRFKNDVTLLEDYDSLYNIISKLRKNGQNNNVVIEIKNRNKFSKSKLYNSDYDLMVEGIDIQPYKLDELKKEDALLDLMITDIKNSNYSPFEKYIATYNIVKKFKQYLESQNDKTESRDIRKFLNNDYMVCVGYANLLQELLNRLEISSYNFFVSTDISYDDGFTLEEKEIELAGHARLIVYVDDPKYGIKGFYVADPTWDNDLEKDYYNHAIMSFDKTGMEKRMFRLSNEDLLMNVKNMEEFSFNVNFIIERLKSSPFNEKLSDDEKEFSAIRSLTNMINNILIPLAPEKYMELKNLYPDVLRGNGNIKRFNDYITKVGEIFIDNLGKDVAIDTVIEAAGIVNKNVFGFNEKQATIYKEQLLQINIERDKLEFPYYYDNFKIK